MKEKTLAVVALWSGHRGRVARLAIAKRLEEAARNLRGDMHTGTFNESDTGAAAVFVITEQCGEVNES